MQLYVFVLFFIITQGAPFRFFQNDTASTDCRIYIETHLPQKKQPLYLRQLADGTYTFIHVKDGQIRTFKGQKLVAFCGGNNNNINGTEHQMKHLRCENERWFLDEKRIVLDEIMCDWRVRATITNTTKPCGTNGTYIHVGFDVEDTKLATVLTSCYNNAKNSVEFVGHRLYGPAMNTTVVGYKRPKFFLDGFDRNKFFIENVYKQESQFDRFNKILRSTISRDKYISQKNFLTRGHLAPAGDFILFALKDATFSYFNVAPQWMSINNGNWKIVEQIVRKLAYNSSDYFEVFTGTHEILQLPNINNKFVDIYIAPDNTVPVPKYFWKLIYRATTKESIAFVTLNDPWAEIRDDIYDICENVCPISGFKRPNWDIISKGLTTCCEFSDLKKRIPKLPNLKNTVLLIHEKGFKSG